MKKRKKAPNQAQAIELNMLKSLRDTGSEITPVQESIIHEHCVKLFFTGYNACFHDNDAFLE